MRIEQVSADSWGEMRIRIQIQMRIQKEAFQGGKRGRGTITGARKAIGRDS